MMIQFSLKLIVCLTSCTVAVVCSADIAILKQHCAKCHTGGKPKGDFSLHELRNSPDDQNSDYWLSSLERIRAGEMPPARHNRMTDEEKQALEAFLQTQITLYEESIEQPLQTPPRRLNNRELENSICDVLLIDHIGSHDPLAMLLGDTLHDGFDTHGDTLGMSEYHLDQYVTAVRRVLDGILLTGDRPPTKHYEVTPQLMHTVDVSNRKRPEATVRNAEGVEIRGTRVRIFCENFEEVPVTGNYRITIRAKALDRHVYSQDETGIFDDDPLTLRMHMGKRVADFDLAEGETQEFETMVWLTEGTTLELSHLTDGLRMRGNGNFKFQNRIAHDYIKANDPELYQHVVTKEVPNAKSRSLAPEHWVHWVRYWQGPRPTISGITIEGPLYDTWPPVRQVALLGDNPSAIEAEQILQPIAQRAWRRTVSAQELAPIVALVESQVDSLGEVGALKEGIIAVFVSPSFLMLNPEVTTPGDLFATKFSYLLGSTTPDDPLIAKVRAGELDSFIAIRDELKYRIQDGSADEFLREFPHAWLQLDRINFMAPDIDQFPLYEKKTLSEDMTGEVLAFFRHNVQENRPVPELLTANYSFVNADLAKIYGLPDVPDDSVFRKYTFPDGRRGGFLGMSAFLTLTADTLSTSPIHRAIYVMENFMGIHPAPPPSDVEIKEPDIRSASTIREVLEAHRSEATCAACHQNIDPFGYAFENFDPIGAWRDHYSVDSTPPGETSRRKTKTLVNLPIDASATFMSGARYHDVSEFRELMRNETSRNRFVRCFITKVLAYANGVEPDNFTEVEAIVRRAGEYDYRIVETLAAIIDSPLFREDVARDSRSGASALSN